MRVENCYYDAFPKVVRADRDSLIEIVPRFDHCRLDDAGEYEVQYSPCEEFTQRSGGVRNRSQRVRPVEGRLRVNHFFEAEQEHVLRVVETSNGLTEPVGDFRIYSVADDLLFRRPYKGDLHIHSHCSDGRESPAYVAAASRRVGMDFMAVTDHCQYAPSLEAQRAFSDVDIDLHIYPGEEVHPPDNPIHIVNFGGSRSINSMFRDDSNAIAEDYRSGVAGIEARLRGLPPGANPHQGASAIWCFERIREAGGLGVFCHPYWFTQDHYEVPGPLLSYLLDTAPFDAIEIISGYHRFEAESNILQVARYHEDRGKGSLFPIVGVSDAHGCERGELFGWYYTIVFSPTLSLPDLTQSIKQGFSVAVEALPGEIVRPFGSFRMVKFALFLLREVFPRHDELCVEEGRLMIEHAAGNPDAKPALSHLKGRTGALWSRCWTR